MQSLHSKIRTHRLCAGLSLANAGALVGVSESMMSLLERGLRRLRPEVEQRLLENYRITKGKKS